MFEYIRDMEIYRSGSTIGLEFYGLYLPESMFNSTFKDTIHNNAKTPHKCIEALDADITYGDESVLIHFQSHSEFERESLLHSMSETLKQASRYDLENWLGKLDRSVEGSFEFIPTEQSGIQVTIDPKLPTNSSRGKFAYVDDSPVFKIELTREEMQSILSSQTSIECTFDFDVPVEAIYREMNTP